MRVVGVLVATAGAVLALANAGSSAIRFGVAGDNGKYGEDGGRFFYRLLGDVGFTENRVTVYWDPTEPATITESAFLDRSLPVAALHGIRVVFNVYPISARAFAVNAKTRTRQFARFLAMLARRYPQVTTYIVGNEPNQPRFWQPQFVRDERGGYRPVAAATFERVLAAAYDALKGVNTQIVVAGVGLSPRGNDSPTASNNVSRSPVRFLRELGAEYRRTKRKRPIMDRLAFHPYPNSNDDPLSRGYPWPGAGLLDLDRIKQAVWDGFHGTAQPVFAESGRSRSPGPRLQLMLDEYARQVAIPPRLDSLYFGAENVPTIDEEEQARIYSAVLRRAACDPTVSDFFLFHAIDEEDLDRFQSGLLRIDLSRRPSYGAVKATLKSLQGRCRGTIHRWSHTTSVVGVKVVFRRGSVRISTAEPASARVAVFPASEPRPAITTALSGSGAVGSRTWLVKARTTSVIGISRPTTPGRYVAAALVRAAMNPARKRLFVGPVFVG